VLLLGDGRLLGTEPDHEPLTDLLTVYFGAGIFTANSAFEFYNWTYGQMQGWQASRLGYLSEPELGYALACYAWLRNERNPRWARFIAPNVGPYFKDGLHFLNHTSHSSLLRVAG
jgi:hypothetical protein